MTVQHQSWIDTWELKSKMSEKNLSRWAWKKVKNGIEVGRRQRDQKSIKATILAKRGDRREDLNARDLRIAAFVCAKLSAAGHDFDFKIECTDGIVYAYVEVLSLLPVHKQPTLQLVAA